MNLFNSKWKRDNQDRLRASGVNKKENHSFYRFLNKYVDPFEVMVADVSA